LLFRGATFCAQAQWESGSSSDALAHASDGCSIPDLVQLSASRHYTMRQN